jgi:hypothetical protein
MVNPGMTYGLNANIYNVADFVMTDESYINRALVAAETASKTVVIGGDCTTAVQAATRTQAAWDAGFAYTWHTLTRWAPLTDYLEDYIALIAASPPPPPDDPPDTPFTVSATASLEGTEFWAGGVYKGICPIAVELAVGTYAIIFYKTGQTALTRDIVVAGDMSVYGEFPTAPVNTYYESVTDGVTIGDTPGVDGSSYDIEATDGVKLGDFPVVREYDYRPIKLNNRSLDVKTNNRSLEVELNNRSLEVKTNDRSFEIRTNLRSLTLRTKG